jgi:hypothetical protein
MDDLRLAREERASRATTAEVCRNLAAFLPQVLSVGVTYRSGDEQLSTTVFSNRTRSILKAFEVERVETLDWPRERWQAELNRLDAAGAGTMSLTPGLGYSLPLVFMGKRQMLIPMFGRLTLKRSPIAAIREAIEEDARQRGAVELLPR